MDEMYICNTQGYTLNLQSPKKWLIISQNNSTYLLCFQTVHFASKTLQLSNAQNRYICGLVKFVNLEYLSKLKQLSTIISTKYHISMPKEWICLYQISSFIPNERQKYSIQQLGYGLDVILQLDRYKWLTVVSNCFGFKGEYFYFLEDLSCAEKQHQLGLIFNSSRQKICGISLSWCGELICVPISSIIYGLSPKIKIEDQILPNLQKTVYLQYRGSHCTGTLISQNTILTVRHIFDSKTPQIGTQINLKLYPYSEQSKAKLKKLYRPEIDLVLLQVVKNIGTQNSKEITNRERYGVMDKDRLQLGQDVIALGFGRFDYSLYKLRQIDVILPTLSRGIVSKIIYANKLPIIFKTDASLHHGFSGCGIWLGKMQKGVAVFIIKNTASSNSLTKHNFSYLTSFVSTELLDRNGEICEDTFETIKNIGKLGVRTHMKIVPSL